MEMHLVSPVVALPSACTQMIILKLMPGISVKHTPSQGAATVREIVQFLESRPGVRRVYWGTGLETADTLHVHVVRERLHQHYDFLASPDYLSLKKKFSSITEGEPVIRHAFLVEYTPGCEALGRGAPFTGTAIYVGTDRAWDYAWQLWTTIVPKVKGCMGVAGGYIVEPIEGHERCFIAWVGWNTVEEHAEYHHTQHWQDRKAILQQGHKGYREYNHVVFDSVASSPKSAL